MTGKLCRWTDRTVIPNYYWYSESVSPTCMTFGQPFPNVEDAYLEAWTGTGNLMLRTSFFAGMWMCCLVRRQLVMLDTTFLVITCVAGMKSLWGRTVTFLLFCEQLRTKFLSLLFLTGHYILLFSQCILCISVDEDLSITLKHIYLRWPYSFHKYQHFSGMQKFWCYHILWVSSLVIHPVDPNTADKIKLAVRLSVHSEVRSKTGHASYHTCYSGRYSDIDRRFVDDRHKQNLQTTIMILKSFSMNLQYKTDYNINFYKGL